MFFVLWAWRRRAIQSFHRISPLIAAIATAIIVFSLAEIFSAKISSATSDKVLISGQSCGQIYSGDPNIVNNSISRTTYTPYLSKKANAYANYVQTCYTSISEAVGCDFFIRRQLPSTIDRNAPCPFQNICRRQDRKTKLDTGFLRIGSDLDFNVPPSLQYTLRMVTHCAPPKPDGYKQAVNYSDDISYMRYHYGSSFVSSSETLNWTSEYPVSSVSQTKRVDWFSTLADYQVE